MKNLLLVAFVASTLLRPSLVLCMEPTGDVRLERQEAVCCESEHATADVAFSARTADDCDGCLDISLAMHSLTLKRVATPNPPTMPYFVLPVVPLLATSTTHARSTETLNGLHSLILSTIVIRC
ncbi:MAG TPA: hypothetical protein VEC56_00405 [Candidatus Krumholzibacteria bacterium]|nr:hypothetical protein [Candidatus Krumholzibacteria bacterium]